MSSSNIQDLIKITIEADASIKAQQASDFKQHVWKETEKVAEIGLFEASIFSMISEDIQTRVLKEEGFDITESDFTGSAMSWKKAKYESSTRMRALYKQSAEVHFKIAQKIWAAAYESAHLGEFSCTVTLEPGESMAAYELVGEAEGFMVTDGDGTSLRFSWKPPST